MLLPFRFVFSEQCPHWLTVGAPLLRRGWREIASLLSPCGDVASDCFPCQWQISRYYLNLLYELAMLALVQSAPGVLDWCE
jgi:hypothetical protein